ncbi:hypothetical protein ABTL07_19775, partial [Acinetobacter baumannii]
MAIIAGAALWLGQRRLAEMVIDRTIDHRVGRDATAGLGDGLHVFLCGTGSPLPDPTRAGPCTAIIAGKHIFIV